MPSDDEGETNWDLDGADGRRRERTGDDDDRTGDDADESGTSRESAPGRERRGSLGSDGRDDRRPPSGTRRSNDSRDGRRSTDRRSSDGRPADAQRPSDARDGRRSQDSRDGRRSGGPDRSGAPRGGPRSGERGRRSDGPPDRADGHRTGGAGPPDQRADGRAGQQAPPDQVACPNCGDPIDARAEFCPSCGFQQFADSPPAAAGTGPEKNPGVAVVLSFFYSGLGQLYNGEIGKGIGFMLIQVVNVLLMTVFIGFLTYPLVWIWGMYDAHNTAKEINRQRAV